MNREDEIFGQAFELPEAERAAFLDHACRDDPALREHIEAVLAGNAADDRFLTVPPASRPGQRPEEQPGDVIGRYTLLRKIGDGGCGVVYLAEQTAPVRRQVALKVIKLGMDTRSVIARFMAERQALAMMDHPDIAHVFEAGATDTGRPFFVMEFVDGVPITKFCDEHRLPISARLELFIRVCFALQHAHQKGIVHRDLKPSNILVALRDGTPAPKVIDFGVAKATQGRLTDDTLATHGEQFIGTPAYMSPEQAALSSRDIDTRSDLYSLGALLYELLAGRTPLEFRNLLQIGLDEIRRQIREVEPPLPSARVATLDETQLAAVAEQRRIVPPKLIALLEGDLDWIVMRCLEKDRVRRYESADSLAQDLKRHLADEPVEARPAGTLYRFQKLARRHRVAFIAGATVSAALILGLVASVSQALRANRAEQVAQQEAAIARAVNEFLVTDLLRQADSSVQADSLEGPNPDLKVREALDRAAQKVGARFTHQPLVEAQVRAAIGESYLGIGLPAQAVPHLLRAHALRESALGAEHPDTLAAKAKLARGYFAEGKLPEAATLQTEIIAAQTRALGDEHLALDVTRNDLADTLEAQGKYAEAVALQQRTLERRRRVLGPEHPDTLWSMGNLGNTFFHQGKFAEAEALQAPSFELRKRILGPEHPATLNGANNLASTYTAQGKYAEAEALHRQTLEILQRVLGPEHVQTVASMINLAASFPHQEKLAEAETLQARALEIWSRVLGPEHPYTLAAMNNLALSFNDQQKYAEAADLLARLREIVTRVSGPEHPNTLVSMLSQGRTALLRNRLAEAETILTETRKKMARVLGAEHPHTLATIEQLAIVYERQNRPAEAVALRIQALDALKRVLGPEHPRSIAMMVTLGTSLLAEKRFADAEPVLRELLAFREKTASDAWSTFNTRSALGGALAGQQRFADAEPFLVSGYEGMSQREAQIPASARVRLKEALERLVQFYSASDRPAAAAAWRTKLDEFERTSAAASAP